MNNNKKDSNHTVIGDKSSQRKTFLIQKLPKKVEDFQNKAFEEIIDNPGNLKGYGIEKKTIPSKIFVMYTRLQILLGLKVSGYTNSLSKNKKQVI